VNECKALVFGRVRKGNKLAMKQFSTKLTGRVLPSFPFQLNLSSSVHRMIQINS
jgi:hypothetical protein